MSDYNDFGPLTEEQRRALERQAVTEAYSPLDFLIPGGIGALFGRQAGRGLARVGEVSSEFAFPLTAGLARFGGYNPAATVDRFGRVGAAVGAIPGAAVGFAGPEVRHRANYARDAEGQPGGFYGQPLPTSSDAEGQPGGLYGEYGYPVNALLKYR